MIWLLGYLAIGVANAAQFALRGGFSEAGEVAFYILAWPAQVVFRLLAWTHEGIEWLYRKLAGE